MRKKTISTAGMLVGVAVAAIAGVALGQIDNNRLKERNLELERTVKDQKEAIAAFHPLIAKFNTTFKHCVKLMEE